MRGIDSYNEISVEMPIEEFVQDHLQLVRKIALSMKKKLPPNIDLDDLIQSGFIGLLEAKNSYKEEMQTPFPAFASHRIKGAMLDALRKNSWANRESIKAVRQMEKAVNTLQQKNGHMPTSDEIMNELKISLDEYTKYCQLINVRHVVSIDTTEMENKIDEAVVSPSRICEKDQLIELLKVALEKLPEREKMVLSLYYTEELTFKEIGEILDLTEARICQIHGEAILKTKKLLKLKG